MQIDSLFDSKFHISSLPDSVSEDNAKEGRALFPRAEYTNEWQPVGRGDPLKEDPTFDYMPPVLDRVRYWREGASKNNNDILLLGVPSKKLSSMKQKEKFTYGPIKRTYYSPPFQHHYSQQQQQHQPYVSGSTFRSFLFSSLTSIFHPRPTASPPPDAASQACNRLVPGVDAPLSAAASPSGMENIGKCLHRAPTGELNQPCDARETRSAAHVNDKASVKRAIPADNPAGGSITR